MKIYASNKKYDLDYFVGKDVWVKVRKINENPVFYWQQYDYRYFKINMKVKNPLDDYSYEYLGKEIWADFVENPNSLEDLSYDVLKQIYFDYGISEVLNLPGDYFEGEIVLVEPLEVLTTEELKNIIEEKFNG
jgi:hypothetical protein